MVSFNGQIVTSRVLIFFPLLSRNLIRSRYPFIKPNLESEPFIQYSLSLFPLPGNLQNINRGFYRGVFLWFMKNRQFHVYSLEGLHLIDDTSIDTSFLKEKYIKILSSAQLNVQNQGIDFFGENINYHKIGN